MKISKLQILEALKEQSEKDHDELPQCLMGCHECEMPDECYKLDKFVEELFKK